MFKRIAIVNRGEAAMRLIHAVRDINAASGDADQITVIALATYAERTAMFAREADETFLIGPAAERPYLNHDLLISTLKQAQADAVWVGWGFVAEDATFADRCEAEGITFIGPSGEAMRRLGDKIGSKLIAEEVGVPVAPWSRGGVDTLDEALAAAKRIGYPLMLKATAGGGGRGIRRVDSADDLTEAYQRTRDEAERAFGSGVVFLERLVSGSRHVEVQLIADGQGTAWALGVRDCSVQRRNQKVIEESASPLLDATQTEELKASAERLALAVDYRGAGTVEFLYNPADESFAFLEVNTRLQVEHPITEAVTDTDLVKLQIQVAQGVPLSGERPVEVGHAVEARLNAEDPDRDFAPAPGRISRLDLPTGPGIRVDTGVAEGDTIPADFDSMVAKVIAVGKDRPEALARLRRAMGATSVVIDGGATNKSFILDLLDQPEVTVGGGSGWADTGWIDRVRAEGGLVNERHAGVALVAAGIEAYADNEAEEISRLLVTARGGRPQVQHRAGRAVELKLRNVTYAVTTFQTGPFRYRVTIASGGQQASVEASMERLDEFQSRLLVNGQRFRVLTATHAPIHLVEVNGVTHRISRDEGGVLRSPAPALVVATPVAVGDVIAAGAPVVVLESMKMETVITAPFAAKVRELHVMTGSQVETGAPLVRLEAVAEDAEDDAPAAEAQTGPGLDLPSAAAVASASERAAEALAELRSSLLGFDVDPTHDPLADYLQARDELRTQGADVIPAEIPLISLFADLAQLGRSRPADDTNAELRVHSDREHFHQYLKSLDVDRAGLPEQFRERLATVLAHYGVTELNRGTELDEAVFRVFLAQQRFDSSVGLITGLLDRWIAEPTPPADIAGPARPHLERLGRASQLRFPIVSDLVRSIRYRWFDEPQVEAERAQSLAGLPAEVSALCEPGAKERDSRIAALAAIPEQISGFICERMRAGFTECEPMLEVLVSRYYQGYQLRDVNPHPVAGRAFVTADYELDGASTSGVTTRLISSYGRAEELVSDSALSNGIASELAARPAGHDAVVDLYLQWPDAPAEAELSEEIRSRLEALAWTRRVRRVLVGLCPGAGREIGYFTYRWSDAELTEDATVRGIHPMIGRRLDLWRLSEFDITRVPAPEEVLLFEAVAKSNPEDRRLVAVAQVRQLGAVRDAEGRLTGLPHAERAVENCLEAIRRARTARGSAGNRLDMNHVWVYVWPTMEFTEADLAALSAKIKPLGTGAGIEEVVARGQLARPDGAVAPVQIRFHYRPGAGTTASVETPAKGPLQPVDDYTGKVLRARRRGLVYPYELSDVLAGADGDLQEYDLDAAGRLVPVTRPKGLNKAGIICALVNTRTELYPEGLQRVVLCGDPTRGLGAVAEPECRRIMAALDLAEELQIPVEWFTLSSGARISMDSGTENMDWVAAALRRIVEFTQSGGEINIVVAGINVGAQPYWNAEATMLMHTRGILVMTPDSAMVLTGKQSLDFSGGVSAEDNFGIGGYDRVMGPNGQAQYWAPDLAGAIGVLMRHYEHTYVVPGEDLPRRAPSEDPTDRDVSAFPHGGEFATVGDVFSLAHNPDRKKPFDIRTVMASVIDVDHDPMERWAGMADADTAVVWDARMGGYPICLLGIESKPVARAGFPPSDGPDTYTAGTLFPASSKKAARAINTASGNRPLVVLANLSGFDGSPESMRMLQLEYGAEIGRAMVDFDGPIVFVVISRYHGGAFVVFSQRLNDNMTVLALEGSFASVIGGAPAAAVVFAGDVGKRAAADARVKELEQRIAQATEAERAALQLELQDVRAAVRAEKISEVAAEFDGIHNIHRAVEVGSVTKVIPTAALRPEIIAAIETGLARAAS